MKVKLLTSRAGIGFSQNRNDVIEVDADEGKRLIEAGQALPEVETRIETAVKKPHAQKAVKG